MVEETKQHMGSSCSYFDEFHSMLTAESLAVKTGSWRGLYCNCIAQVDLARRGARLKESRGQGTCTVTCQIFAEPAKSRVVAGALLHFDCTV